MKKGITKPNRTEQQLSTRDEQLVKAIVTELKQDSVKSKLIKIFSNNSEVSTPELSDINIKTEPVYHTRSTQKITLYLY